MIKDEFDSTQRVISDMSSSDEESSSDRLSERGTIYAFDAVLRFHVHIEPETLSHQFSLKLFEYVHSVQSGDNEIYDALAHSIKLDKSIDLIDQPFFSFCESNTMEGIAEIIKTLAKPKTAYLMGNREYLPTLSGLITGRFVDYFWGKQGVAFATEDFPVFLSLIDLLMRNKPELDGLEPELVYQEMTYDLVLTTAEKVKLMDALSRHPMNMRQAALTQYRRSLRADRLAAPTQPSEPSFLGRMVNEASRVIQAIVRELIDNDIHSDDSSIDNNSSAEIEEEVMTDENSSDDASSTETEEDDILTLSSEESEDTLDCVDSRKLAISQLFHHDDIGFRPGLIKDDLIRLFETRCYFVPSIDFYNRLVVVNTVKKYFFTQHLDSEARWNDEETKSLAHSLMMDFILLTDSILADVELFLMQAGQEVNDRNVIDLLTDERYVFGERFLHSGLVNLYAYYREKPHHDVSHDLQNDKNPVFTKHTSGTEALNRLFFSKNGTKECRHRKYYNTFIKYGFVERYPEAERGVNFREQLARLNPTLDRWTSTDKRQYSSASNPTLWRPRSDIANPANVRHTYTHPVFKASST